MELKTFETTRRSFFGAAVFGAFAAGSPLAIAQGSERTAAEKANVQIINDFCAAWASRDMEKPLAFLSSDCVYRMSETTPPVNGHEGVIQRLKSYIDASNRVEFEVLETFAAGPLVINRRIDRYISPARPLIWEGVGVFFVQNGKIKEWSDYTTKVTR